MAEHVECFEYVLLYVRCYITFCGAVERYGKSLQGNVLIDNPDLSYSGSLDRVKDTGVPDALMNYDGAFHFRDGDDYRIEYYHDGCGSVVSDINKGIANIDYDFNGMPRRIQFTNGNVTEYVYSSDGVKLKTIHRTAVKGITVHEGKTKELTSGETQKTDSVMYFSGFEIHNSVSNGYHYFSDGYITMGITDIIISLKTISVMCVPYLTTASVFVK